MPIGEYGEVNIAQNRIDNTLGVDPIDHPNKYIEIIISARPP